MNRTPLIIGGVVILAIAAIILAITGGGLYSVIGEEGWQSYDPLLTGGAYDKNLWTNIIACDNTVGERATACNTLRAYQGVSVAGGGFVCGHATGAGTNICYTRDLRLQDFRATIRINSERGGTGAIETRDGTVWSYMSTVKSWRSDTAGIELTWDDYELGHYQLKLNGRVIQEGTVPEGQEYRITLKPHNPWGGDQGKATVALEEARYHALFACDLSEGQVKAHACFTGPSTIRLRDLQGFEQFCTSLPATFTDAGIVASSKRVYYELAKDESIPVEENQIWEFQYLADSKAVGQPTTETGIVELCDDAIFIDDINDLPNPAPVLLDTKLTWTSSGRYDGSEGYRTRNTDLASGSVIFLETSPLIIDDKKCPYTTEWREYPGIDRACVSVTAFGKTFRDGDTVRITPTLDLTLEDLSAQYRDDDGDDLYRWSATWRLEFAKNAISVQPGSGPEEVVLTNTLPGPTTIILTSNHKIGSIDESIIDTQTLTLKAGATRTVTIPLHDEYTGTTTLTVRPTIQTITGGIAQETLTVTYQGDATNQSEAAAPPTEPSNDTHQGTESRLASFFKNIWAWITGLFGSDP